MALSRDFILKKFETPFPIGVSGFATAGKDTFFTLFERYLGKYNLKVKRYALADRLKEDMDPFLKEKFGISAWTKNPEEKKLIRPLLVEYGRTHRLKSQGTYWTGLVTPLVKESLARGEIPVLTDIRYAQYQQDEIHWLKSLGGKLVYVARCQYVGGVKEWIDAPNKDEATNDPFLRNNAQVTIGWDTYDNIDVIPEKFIEDAVLKL